jgi:signal transduction histidine kinase
MGDLPFLIKVGFAGLIYAEIAVLCIRFPTCAAKGELVRFALFLCLLSFRLLLPRSSLFSLFSSAAIVWAAGELLLTALGLSGRVLWGILNSVSLAALAVLAVIGGRTTLLFTMYRCLALGLMGFVPIRLLTRIVRRSRSVMDALALLSGILFLAAGCAEICMSLLGRLYTDLGAWPVCLLSFSTGYMIFQESYLQRNSWRTFEERISGNEKLMRDAYARLLQTENALVLQDRLIVTGLLAMGAAHEFKNALAHIKATAEFGLGRREVELKDRSLRLLAEHAEVGGKAAVDFLERFSLEGREEVQALDVRDLLSRILHLARASFRSQGILISMEVPPGLRVAARRGEIEQVLLNLTGNAVDGFKKCRSEGEKLIEIISSRHDGVVCIDVRDNAGGVDPGVAGRLFQISCSETGRTGLGLYLSRSLAERNDGSLAYSPRDGGSCFRLVLPLASERVLDTPQIPIPSEETMRK